MAVSGTSFGVAVYNFLQVKSIHEDIRTSYLVRNKVDSIYIRKDRKNITNELQAIRESLEPEERSLALSDIIQSYTSNSWSLLKRRIKHFEKVEAKYIEFLLPKAEYLEKNILYYFLISSITFILGMFFLREYVAKAVFEPLLRVTTKMMDFLNGKYSYKFEVPPSNELGDLQSTFNSMAQRVLHNMEELEHLDRAKSEFLNIASHELRTPMTSIKGSLGLLTSGALGDLDPEVQNMIGIAESETDRLIRLINEILDLAKIEARKMPMKLSWNRLDEVIQESVNGLNGLCKSSGVSISCANLPDYEVNVDRDRIQQVITNLLSNAIKYSPKGKAVEVTVEQDGPGPLFIGIRDYGKGIHPDEQAQIFEKFRQATNSDNPLVKGTGLGLAIAKAIVEEHLGHLGVQSDIGEGSTFYFTLPNWRELSNNESQESQKEAA